jgi:hypothetical protein
MSSHFRVASVFAGGQLPALALAPVADPTLPPAVPGADVPVETKGEPPALRLVTWRNAIEPIEVDVELLAYDPTTTRRILSLLGLCCPPDHPASVAAINAAATPPVDLTAAHQIASDLIGSAVAKGSADVSLIFDGNGGLPYTLKIAGAPRDGNEYNFAVIEEIEGDAPVAPATNATAPPPPGATA